MTAGLPGFFGWLSQKYPEVSIVSQSRRARLGLKLERNFYAEMFDNLNIHWCANSENRPAPKDEAKNICENFRLH